MFWYQLFLVVDILKLYRHNDKNTAPSLKIRLINNVHHQNHFNHWVTLEIKKMNQTILHNYNNYGIKSKEIPLMQ